jgi:putative transposase
MQTFFCDADYELYIRILAAEKEKSRVDIWAYCLMPNHVHMVAVPKSDDGLARLYREAHKTYAREINRRNGWQGHLWQERFRSFVMDEEHLMAAVRYIELNPVRAEICRHPKSWPWSSFAAHVAGTDDMLVSVKPMLERIVDWERYISLGGDESQVSSIRAHSLTGRPVGSDSFLDEIARKSGRDLTFGKPGPKSREK